MASDVTMHQLCGNVRANGGIEPFLPHVRIALPVAVGRVCVHTGRRGVRYLGVGDETCFVRCVNAFEERNNKGNNKKVS